MSDGSELSILLCSIFVDLLMVEPGFRGFNSMSFSHFEILSEVLFSAPPVQVDHRNTFVSSHLMEVGVSHVVLLPVSWESSISMGWSVGLVSFSNHVSPVGNHKFLLYCHLRTC